MNSRNILRILLITLIFTFLASNPALAGQVTGGIATFGEIVYGSSPQDPRTIAALIINSLLTVLGIIAVVLIVYSGFIYMTSQGEEAKVKKAKNIIIYAAIGLAIIIMAYAITTFIYRSIQESAGPGYQGAYPTGQ